MTTIAKVDLRREASSFAGDWKNWVLANVNDHVVRISVMRRDFHWHRHSNSDEVLMPLEGNLIVDFEDQSITVTASASSFACRRMCCTGPETRGRQGRYLVVRAQGHVGDWRVTTTMRRSK